MLRGISDAERQALRERGWARATGVMPSEVLDALDAEAAAATWTATTGDGFSLETTTPGASVASLNLDSARLMRHGSGHYGLPPVESGIGVIIELAADWPSRHGGLLLVSEAGAMHGWRPERGARILFDAARPPTLTMVTPAAPGPRLALLGRLQEA